MLLRGNFQFCAQRLLPAVLKGSSVPRIELRSAVMQRMHLVIELVVSPALAFGLSTKENKNLDLLLLLMTVFPVTNLALGLLAGKSVTRKC